jgi:DNA-binding response OmpR family regulator
MLDIAQQNSLRLSRLINDLLDMDKLAAGKLAYAAQHRVELKLDSALPLRIRADALRLQQVLANFLSSAIKFSAPGSPIRLHSTRHHGRVRIGVSDQGPGIAEPFRAHIFEKFSQADSGDQRQKGGSGLGLAISKELIEHMGGQIGFDSAEGCSNTFWFELPLLDDDPADLQPERQQPAILVVESDPESSHLLQSLLQRAGYRVLLAGSLAQARALLLSERIAAITLDPHLPDGDGLQLIQELRNDPARHQLPVLVIATSSHQGRLSLADFIPANNLVQARELLEKGGLDLILLDLSLPDGNGLELFEDIQRLHPSLPVVVLSSSEVSSKQLSLVAATLAKSRTDTQHFLNVLARLLPAKENHHA